MCLEQRDIVSSLSETDGDASTASSSQRPVGEGASAALCMHRIAPLNHSSEEEGMRKLELTFLFFLTALHVLKQGSSGIDKVVWRDLTLCQLSLLPGCQALPFHLAPVPWFPIVLCIGK